MRDHTRPVRIFVMGGIGLVTALIYGEALSGYFLGDDLGILYTAAYRARKDQMVLELLRELTAPLTAVGFFYRPLSLVSFAGDYLTWGTNPIGWHLTNILLHMANVALLWGVVEQIAGRPHGLNTIAVGGAAAALFALRPSSPETVALLSARHDELVLLGFLVALLAYLRANGRWGRYYLLALGGFLFALGSKEAGVTLPGGLVAVHIAGVIPIKPKVGEPRWLAWVRQTIIGVGPFVFVLLAYFAWRLFLFGTPFKTYPDVPPVDLTDPAWRAAKLHALRFFLAPSLSMTPLVTGVLLATIAQVLVGVVAAWHSPAARRVWVFGACWLMATLLPLAQLLFIAPTGEGARLLYIPGAPLTVLLAAPLAVLSELSWREKTLSQRLSIAGVVGVVTFVFLSVPLLMSLLRPWLEAGKGMKALPAAIAARAEAVLEGSFAVLLVPDHVGGALFARNGQGALMEPPVQAQSLRDRILVMTFPLSQDPSRLAVLPQPLRRLEHWCWNVTARRFEQLRIPEHAPDAWLDVWKSALQKSGCSTEIDR